ncbi:MAG: alcohol dehydrogenase catalytic domain-containing protein [Aigarchaeota archaeon]|nr:alcohol dehydrogenase catalytic domain-containing protein [Aigarchaeota archaeon]
MKAAIFAGKEKFEVRELDRPHCGEGEVLVKVRACAICGSDLRIFHGSKSIDVPITGHEISGTVEEVGKRVEGVSVGDRVVIETVVGCGECDACRRGEENRCLNKYRAIGYQYNGAFAQFILIPKEAVKQGNVIEVSDSISFDEAAIVEPLSCVLNGWEPFKKRSEGFTTVVMGAGPIGMLHSEYAKSLGSRVILVNRTAPRLRLAEKIGLSADVVVDASECDLVERVIELTDSVGANAVICAASSKEIQEQALEMAAVDADVSYFAGISKDDPLAMINTNLLHYKELHVHGANASNRRQYLAAVDLIASGKIGVKKIITHRFPLGKIDEAIRTAEDRSMNALKVIVDPWM